MNRAIILWVALLTGCFILPTESTTEKVVARGTSTIPAAFEVDAQRFDIHVVTSAPHSCVKRRYVDLDVTHGKEAEFVGPELDDMGNPGPYGLVLMLMGTIATLPISGIVTAIVVGVSDETTVRERRYVDGKRVACDRAERIAVTFTWPSGARTQHLTDLRGVATAHVPASEVDAGVVIVRVADLPARTIKYSASAGSDQRWAHRLAEAR